MRVRVQPKEKVSGFSGASSCVGMGQNPGESARRTISITKLVCLVYQKVKERVHRKVKVKERARRKEQVSSLGACR